MTSQHEISIDRRLFLGAVGALTLLGQPAFAQDGKSEAKTSLRRFPSVLSSSISGTASCRRPRSRMWSR